MSSFRLLWETVSTQANIQNNSLVIPDPSGKGLKITAQIELIAGRMGKGEYMPVLSIIPKNNTGGAGFHGELTYSLEAAQTELAGLMKNTEVLRKFGLERFGLPTILVHRLKPKIAYNDRWSSGALERQPGYNPGEHDLQKKFYNQLIGNIDQLQAKVADELKKVPRFGDSKPQFGQYITQDDIELIPDLINSFGDFWVIINWSKRGKQRVKASDLYKHYDKILSDAEVKAKDYIREIFVKQNPKEGL